MHPKPTDETQADRQWQVATANSIGPSASYIIDQLFTYHAPNAEQMIRYETIRDAAKHFALVIWKNCPEGSDRVAAIRKLREAVMTANAAIALNGMSL